LRRLRLATAALLVALLPLPLRAFVPAPEKLTDAAARANFGHGRTGGLRLEVALFTEPPAPGLEPIATGELLTDPTRSAARLDLVGRNGVREQHLWTGAGARTWRDGTRLADARALLPPFYLLQFRYGRSLRSALQGLGVDLERADLARNDAHDCFVIGGSEPGPAPQGFARNASLWLDSYSYEIVRIDLASGARFRFGPVVDLGDRRLPSWVALEEEGRPPLYLALRGAARAKLSAGDFRAPAP
jgi:hypothetical protein